MFRSDESDEQGGDMAGDEPCVPAATAASWRSAESQLFGALVTSPDVYQSVVVVVGATVDRLRSLGPSTRDLLGAAADITTVVAAVRAAGGSAADGIDPDLVGRAALALRHREVLVERAAARRRDLLAAAGATGADWVVLEEAGDWAGDPFAPYRRLEAHATTGQALLVTASPDDDFRTSRHTVEVLTVDLDTGQMEQSHDQEAGPDGLPSASDREVHVTTLRALLSRSG